MDKVLQCKTIHVSLHQFASSSACDGNLIPKSTPRQFLTAVSSQPLLHLLQSPLVSWTDKGEGSTTLKPTSSAVCGNMYMNTGMVPEILERYNMKVYRSIPSNSVHVVICCRRKVKVYHILHTCACVKEVATI